MRPFTLDRLEQMHRGFKGRAFIRHDVDVSLTAAHTMAEWENQREIHATYYLMSTSPFYSAADAAQLAVALHRLGHQVGYHWDTRHPFPQGMRSPNGDRAVSFHCPDEHLLWRDFRAFDNAYGSRWKGVYYADSRGCFSHGDPENHDGPWPIQVNLHCEHWMEPDAYNDIAPDIFEAFFKEPHPHVGRTL